MGDRRPPYRPQTSLPRPKSPDAPASDKAGDSNPPDPQNPLNPSDVKTLGLPYADSRRISRS